MPPDALGAIAGRLAVELAGRAGRKLEAATPAGPIDDAKLKALADRLWHSRGKSLVVCDSQDVPTQIVCNFINDLLQGYGQTLEIAPASQQRSADDGPLAELLEQLKAGQVGVLVIAGVNPVYDLPSGPQIGEWLRGDKAPFVVRLGQHADETAEEEDHSGLQAEERHMLHPHHRANRHDEGGERADERIGIGNVGGFGGNSSGDIFLAFSTANAAEASKMEGVAKIDMLPNERIDRLFDATVQATEEAIVNALVAARTMTGYNGNTAHAIPHDRLREALKKYNRLTENKE